MDLPQIFNSVWDSINSWLGVNLASLISGEDEVANRLLVEEQNNYAYISTAATTVVKNTNGFLKAVTIEGGASGTVILYDNPSGVGTVIASFDATNTPMTYEFDVQFTLGLTVITSAATKLTIAYR
jgi:hypothetical protein